MQCVFACCNPCDGMLNLCRSFGPKSILPTGLPNLGFAQHITLQMSMSNFFFRSLLLFLFYLELHLLPMATILESDSAFNARAFNHGLTRPQLQRLQNHGLTSLSKLAFSITTPATVPTDDALRGLLDENPDEVTVGQLSSTSTPDV